MLVWLLIALAAVAMVIAMRPDTFSVSRSAIIQAVPERVFEQINTMRKWNAWSPWARLDPQSVTTYDGPEAGVDASLAWNGNNKIGQGRMTVIESKPDSLVRLRLDFERPFKATNYSEFVLEPEGGNTRVVWSMKGTNNFIGKAMSLFMNCERMVGEQFEKGLANLNAVVTGAVNNG